MRDLSLKIHNETRVQQSRSDQAKTSPFTFRKPTDKDGRAVYELIRQCPPLDANSMYCNLLQCTHFSDSCILAEEREGRPAGFISAYIPPDEPDTLFVWQVAVHKNARGCGLGKKMLRRLLDRPACRAVKKLQTTITRDNKASWGLFKSFAREKGAACHDEVMFCRKEHFSGRHASEHLLTIAPL